MEVGCWFSVEWAPRFPGVEIADHCRDPWRMLSLLTSAQISPREIFPGSWKTPYPGLNPPLCPLPYSASPGLPPRAGKTESTGVKKSSIFLASIGSVGEERRRTPPSQKKGCSSSPRQNYSVVIFLRWWSLLGPAALLLSCAGRREAMF